MPKDYPRSARVADLIRRELVQLIRTEIKDPRLNPMLTISAVDVAHNLASANVFVSMIDDEPETSVNVLNNAAGFLRKQLGRLLNLRHVPKLQFKYDHSIEHGSRLSKLIDDAVQNSDLNKNQNDSSE